MFNKKFKKLLKRKEWDHKVNLLEYILKKFNAKAYTVIVGITSQGRAYSRIKFEICNTIFLYSKEEQIPTASIRLQKVKLAYNKEQDIIREVTNKLKNIKYFNKLYIIWGYNNIQIKEEDK